MENEKNKHGVYRYCRKSTQYSIYSRQCFVTGELCSKQSNVHKERERLHSAQEINAFVVMNFSDMSDVVYKWKLRSFIESLKKHLYLNPKIHEIACVAGGKEDLPTLGAQEGTWEPVNKINVVRADSHTASNYIICNRVCQQMQIADLVIVDVSVENTNVFYEFGMAAAFGKLILPICYNESFYQMQVPEKAQEYLAKKMQRGIDQKYRNFTGQKKQSLKDVPGLPRINVQTNQLREMIEHHIDCYPWRRKLFEFYGIRYRNGKSGVGYTDFADIVDPSLGFSDIQYNRFPYDAELPKEDTDNQNAKKVGELLYGRLANSYNKTTETVEDTDQKSPFNTVVVYTMDGIINDDQAGQCIINFYRNMTHQIRKEYCFCGDRVGVMGQANIIPDDPKDTKTGQKLLYRVSDVIRIGMNEATHVAQKHRIKTDDYMLGMRDEMTPEQEQRLTPKSAETLTPEPEARPASEKGDKLNYDKDWRSEAIRFTKEHVRNRCIPIYPDEPIYVQELRDGIQKGILSDTLLKAKQKENDFDYEHFFCLFHVTLHTLRYTNEIVVDLSRNSLQALFWLGVAHGCNAQTITVRHAPTADELERSDEKAPVQERNIFDVAGLWTAVLHSNDTDGFYRQLAMTQVGIEQHSKLTLPEAETEFYREQVLDEFFETSPYMKFGFERFHARLFDLKGKKMSSEDKPEELLGLCEDMQGLLEALYDNTRMNAIWKTLSDRNRKESERLESYYRSLFWRRMLRYNELQLYTTQQTGHTHGEPRRVSITWDVDATAELSSYLSKRTTIGRYRVHALQEKAHDPKSRERNYICIGGENVPMQAQNGVGIPLVMHIRERIGEQGESDTQNVVRHLAFCEMPCEYAPKEHLPDDAGKREEALKVHSYRGFVSEDGKKNVFARFLKARCTGNMIAEEGQEKGQEKYLGCTISNAQEAGDQHLLKLYTDTVTANNDWNDTGKGTFSMGENVSDCCGLVRTEGDRYYQLAQMILWREVPEEVPQTQKRREDVKYWVSLVGVSGPATLALTSLLVDEGQKRDIFGRKQDPVDKLACFPLNDLQTQIRKTLIHSYGERLEDELKQNGLEKLKDKVRDATGMYLTTVLYHYFFPFLSRADERRIHNSVEAYLSATGFRDMFQGEDYGKIAKLVLKTLDEVVSGLRGTEALYAVDVTYGKGNKDDRWPIDIRPLRWQKGEQKGKPMVSCLFAKPKEDSKEAK